MGSYLLFSIPREMSKLLLLAFLAILPLPMVHAQGTPLLFVGPDYFSYGESEVFSLPAQGGSLSKPSCSVPDYPLTDVGGYVAFVKDGYLQICGGFSYSNEEYQSACYLLRDSAWETTTQLMMPRYLAAATTLHTGSVLISGGYATGNETSGTKLSSSEIWTGTTWAPALELPSARAGHCLILLSTGEFFLHGGRDANDTYLSTDLTSWQPMTSSEVARTDLNCIEFSLGTEQEVWVGGRGRTTEIYSVATDTWRAGPDLPSRRSHPGKFVSYNDQLYYADDDSNIYHLKDGWEKIWDAYGKRLHYQAMIISQDICEGKKTKRPPLELSYTPDGSVGYVSGSLVSVVTRIASDSPTPVSVSCCGGGEITPRTCGNGTSCTNICGGISSGCITLELEKGAAVCDTSMHQHQWCANADTIQGLTSGCSRKKRDDQTQEEATAVTTPDYDISNCKYDVWTTETLEKNPTCCFDGSTRRIPALDVACCTDHKACF